MIIANQWLVDRFIADQISLWAGGAVIIIDGCSYHYRLDPAIGRLRFRQFIDMGKHFGKRFLKDVFGLGYRTGVAHYQTPSMRAW